MTQASPPSEVHGTALRPPEVERAYRARYLGDDARLAAAFIGIVTVAYAPFAASDPMFASSPRALAVVLSARVAFTALGVLAIAGILRTRRPVVLDRWGVAWSLAFAVRGIVFQSTRPPDHFLPILGEIVVSMCLWAMLLVPFPLQAVAAGLVTAGAFTWMLAFRGPAPYDGWAVIVLTWTLGNGIGAYASWRAHRQRRTTYLDMLRLDAAEKQALEREEALRESENRFRQLANEIPIGIFQVGPDGDTRFVNPTWLKITGLSEEEAIGPDAGEAIHPDDRERVTRLWNDATSSGMVFSSEYRLRSRDGRDTWVRGFGTAVRDPSGTTTSYVGALVDISEARRLQAELAQASRLAAMGTLVAGVAHEINNPLAATLANQGLALELVRGTRDAIQATSPVERDPRLRNLDEVIEALAEAQESGRRIAQIVKDMATFANPNPRRTRARLGDLVQGAMRWFPSSLGQPERIRVEDAGAPEVMAAPGQLEQVVHNLITNAARASPESGRIVVRFGPGSAGMARLEVIDQGVGIPDRDLERIFEPFYTTRPAGEGRGAGLGLAISRAIIGAQGGTIAVRSEVGKGSTFTVELPVAAAGA